MFLFLSATRFGVFLLKLFFDFFPVSPSCGLDRIRIVNNLHDLILQITPKNTLLNSENLVVAI